MSEELGIFVYIRLVSLIFCLLDYSKVVYQTPVEAMRSTTLLHGKELLGRQAFIAEVCVCVFFFESCMSVIG